MIVLENIHKWYKSSKLEYHALKGIDLEINKGEMVSIVGASGSGKSTLLNILGLLDKYDHGSYFLNGNSTKDLEDNQIADLRSSTLGFVFQSFNLITYKNALENTALPLFYQKVRKRKRNEIALEYLDRVGLRNWSNHLPNEMSGGQQQRVAIARALITNPKIILADEPTGALDSETSEEITALLKEINNQGITVIIVTHEKSVSEIASKKVFMRDGFIQNIIVK